MTKLATAIATLIVPTLAAAHPDHLGDAAPGLAHFLTDPFHVGLIVLAVAGGLALRTSKVEPARERSER